MGKNIIHNLLNITKDVKINIKIMSNTKRVCFVLLLLLHIIFLIFFLGITADSAMSTIKTNKDLNYYSRVFEIGFGQFSLLGILIYVYVMFILFFLMCFIDGCGCYSTRNNDIVLNI